MGRLDPDDDYAYDVTNRSLGEWASDEDDDDPELVENFETEPGRPARRRGRTVNEPLMLICAWCGFVIRPGKLPASHGICPRCAENERKKLEPES